MNLRFMTFFFFSVFANLSFFFYVDIQKHFGGVQIVSLGVPKLIDIFFSSMRKLICFCFLINSVLRLFFSGLLDEQTLRWDGQGKQEYLLCSHRTGKDCKDPVIRHFCRAGNRPMVWALSRPVPANYFLCLTLALLLLGKGHSSDTCWPPVTLFPFHLFDSYQNNIH